MNLTFNDFFWAVDEFAVLGVLVFLFYQFLKGLVIALKQKKKRIRLIKRLDFENQKLAKVLKKKRRKNE